MYSAISASNAGIQSGLASFQQAAERIADPETGVDARDLVEVKLAEAHVKANAAVLRRSFEMTDELIDILA